MVDLVDFGTRRQARGLDHALDHLALGQQVYLQVEMRPLVGLSGQPILACEHEQRQEDGFE